MNYKEEIINALADVCKRARKEGYEEADSNQRENAVYEYERGYEEGLKRGEDIEQANAAETKKEVAKQNYERGLNDAWEYARKIVLGKTDGGIGINAVIAIFGNTSTYEIFMDFTVPEVISKIKDYYKSLEKSQIEDEIKIGDEVEIPQMESKGIVVATANKETILVLSKYMDGLLRTEKHKVKKTGRYFPQINEIIKNMYEDE